MNGLATRALVIDRVTIPESQPIEINAGPAVLGKPLGSIEPPQRLLVRGPVIEVANTVFDGPQTQGGDPTRSPGQGDIGAIERQRHIHAVARIHQTPAAQGSQPPPSG